jgi:sirohydrochlorin cobaltochelatase
MIPAPAAQSPVILLIGHGSRHAPGNDAVRRFAEHTQARHPQRQLFTCFVELAEPTLADGLAQAAQAARAVNPTAPKVVAVPLIINAAGHVKMEIPEAVAAAQADYPDVTFQLVPQIGTDEPLTTALLGELHAALRRLAMPDPKTTGVIVLGRGSSDPGANGEMAKLTRILWEYTDHELVELAFTGVTYPRLETVAQRLIRLGMTQIVVLPVYLFTGTLIERIAKQVARLERQYPTIAWAVGAPLAFRDEFARWLDQLLTQPPEAVPTLACFGCKYRLAAADKAAHHHHHLPHNHPH